MFKPIITTTTTINEQEKEEKKKTLCGAKETGDIIYET